jgi:hypothetical protein
MTVIVVSHVRHYSISYRKDYFSPQDRKITDMTDMTDETLYFGKRLVIS